MFWELVTKSVQGKPSFETKGKIKYRSGKTKIENVLPKLEKLVSSESAMLEG